MAVGPTRSAPYAMYDSKRHRYTLDEAWRLVEAQLPDGWHVGEVSYLSGPGRGIAPCWYASACDADGDEWIEGEDSSPLGGAAGPGAGALEPTPLRASSGVHPARPAAPARRSGRALSLAGR